VTQTTVQAAHRRATIIVGAMISSLVVYVLVVEVVSRTAAVGMSTQPPEIVRWILYGVALSMVFACNLVRPFMLRGVRPAPEGTVDEMVARLTTAHVVTAALAETPAVVGLVLYFIGGQSADFYILAVVSLYLLMRHFPRLGQWMARVQPYLREGES
jgi:hypothetical protein